MMTTSMSDDMLTDGVRVGFMSSGRHLLLETRVGRDGTAYAGSNEGSLYAINP